MFDRIWNLFKPEEKYHQYTVSMTLTWSFKGGSDPEDEDIFFHLFETSRGSRSAELVLGKLAKEASFSKNSLGIYHVLVKPWLNGSIDNLLMEKDRFSSRVKIHFWNGKEKGYREAFLKMTSDVETK